MPALVLLSGGIDSTACAKFLVDRGFSVRCLFIDYGQKAARLEERAVRQIAHYFRIPFDIERLRFCNRFKVGEHPGRNAFLIFSSLLAGSCENGVIAIGIHSGTEYYDCSHLFIERMNVLIQEYTRGKVSLLTPFLDWTKDEVFEYFTSKRLPIQMTYSCEKGTNTLCGKCKSCQDRERLSC